MTEREQIIKGFSGAELLKFYRRGGFADRQHVPLELRPRLIRAVADELSRCRPTRSTKEIGAARHAARVRANANLPYFTHDQAMAVTARVVHLRDTVASIAEEFGCDVMTIRKATCYWSTPEQRAAARVAKIKLNRRGKGLGNGKPEYDWGSADWTLPDRAIARKLRCSRTTVGNARRRLCKPRPAARFEMSVRLLGTTRRGRQLAEKRIVRRVLHTNISIHAIAEELEASIGWVHKIVCRHSTPEQRREARRRKVTASLANAPTGAAMAKMRRAAKRRELAAMVAAPVLVEVKPPRGIKAKAAANVSAFLAELEAA